MATGSGPNLLLLFQFFLVSLAGCMTPEEPNDSTEPRGPTWPNWVSEPPVGFVATYVDPDEGATLRLELSIAAGVLGPDRQVRSAYELQVKFSKNGSSPPEARLHIDGSGLVVRYDEPCQQVVSDGCDQSTVLYWHSGHLPPFGLFALSQFASAKPAHWVAGIPQVLAGVVDLRGTTVLHSVTGAAANMSYFYLPDEVTYDGLGIPTAFSTTLFGFELLKFSRTELRMGQSLGQAAMWPILKVPPLAQDQALWFKGFDDAVPEAEVSFRAAFDYLVAEVPEAASAAADGCLALAGFVAKAGMSKGPAGVGQLSRRTDNFEFAFYASDGRARGWVVEYVTDILGSRFEGVADSGFDSTDPDACNVPLYEGSLSVQRAFAITTELFPGVELVALDYDGWSPDAPTLHPLGRGRITLTFSDGVDLAAGYTFPFQVRFYAWNGWLDLLKIHPDDLARLDSASGA